MLPTLLSLTFPLFHILSQFSQYLQSSSTPPPLPKPSYSFLLLILTAFWRLLTSFKRFFFIFYFCTLVEFYIKQQKKCFFRCSISFHLLSYFSQYLDSSSIPPPTFKTMLPIFSAHFNSILELVVFI